MKRIISFVLVISMVLAMGIAVFAEEVAKFEIKINGQELAIPVEMGVAHIDEAGRTQVPARAIIEGLGYVVDWKGETQTVIILDQNKKEVATIQIGSKIVKLADSKTIEMDTKAMVGKDGRTYIPLRFVSQALGFDIPKEGGYNFENGIHKINIVELKETVTEDGVIVIDISDVEVPTYTSESGKVTIMEVGSNQNSMLGTREEGSTYAQDLEKFNKALKGTTWKLSSGGSLQWENQPGNDPNAPLKIDRTEKDEPRVKIRIWDANMIAVEQYLIGPVGMTMNVSMEALKYYSAGSPSEGEAIWWYINQHIEQSKEFEYGKVYKFGSTEVVFYDPGVAGFDIIFTNSEIRNIETLNENQLVENGDVTVVDISNVEVPTYTNASGRVSELEVGSNEGSILEAREEGSTHADDISKINEALKGTSWKLSDAGNLQFSNQPGNDPNAQLIVDRKDGNPRVKIRNWIVNPGDEQLTRVLMVVNTFVESAKYYAKKPSDGEAIFWYVNKAVEEGKDVPVGKVMQFGDTKIIFEDPNIFGINVIFLN
ncbi:copper amine oxidase N-terminal domain-containing protein [Brassicibacter mesophilus]|uniref:copper amine oxidase N-terminal domain-containing protein n=1 Tax=Brassicibacter mesophilus TaxID=745119 RepID=UPI003D2497F0